MDILLSALANDIVSRLISFLVAKYQRQSTKDKLVRLQQLLLRARFVVEEAEGRHISNQGMLLQLRQLRKDMYRGYYVLDTFKKHAAVSASFSFHRLEVALESLEATVGDMKEFIVFLSDLPCILRQPYSTYLFMERCMFGRHTEKEQIINFLLRPCTSSLSVLPIIGPREVGKTTLVEHVCNEERVREQFPLIVRLNSNDLKSLENDSFIRIREGVVSDARSLIVIDLVGDIDDATWRRFSSLACFRDSGNSKAILLSTTDKVSCFGTAPALRLKKLRRDEYWYFFRTLAFGSAKPDDHEELASIAREIATQIKGTFIAANIFARLLRGNLDAQFWLHTLEFVRKAVQLHLLVCGEEHSWDPVSRSCRYYLAADVDGLVLVSKNGYKTADWLANRELPKITADDVITRCSAAIPSEGSFDLLRWRSPIPPYYSYVANCVVEKACHVMPKDKCAKRKRGW